MIHKFNVQALAHRELRSSKTGEAYSLSAVLTDPLGFTGIFVHHDILPPGHRASGAHFHTRREELVIVLEGRVTVRCNGETLTLVSGDFCGFPPGPDHMHDIVNETDAPASILVIASSPKEDAVISR